MTRTFSARTDNSALELVGSAVFVSTTSRNAIWRLSMYFFILATWLLDRSFTEFSATSPCSCIPAVLSVDVGLGSSQVFKEVGVMEHLRRERSVLLPTGYLDLLVKSPFYVTVNLVVKNTHLTMMKRALGKHSLLSHSLLPSRRGAVSCLCSFRPRSLVLWRSYLTTCVLSKDVVGTRRCPACGSISTCIVVHTNPECERAALSPRSQYRKHFGH